MTESSPKLKRGEYLGRENVIKVKYSPVDIWDMIIEQGNPSELAKTFLVSGKSKHEQKKVISMKTLNALVVKEHINIDKTLKSFAWRIEHLYHIRDRDGQIITFKMNKAQRHFIKYRWFRNIILKSRQLGFSTLALILGFDEAFWNPYKNNIIVAHKVTDAKKLFRRIEFAYNTLPKFIKEFTYLKSKTAEQMEFGFDKISGKALSEQPGQVLSTISVSTSGRSDALSSAHITELAYLDRHDPQRAEEIQSGTIPAIPDDGQLTIESTSEGNTGIFAGIYKGASDKPIFKKDYKKFFYNWTWSDYDIGKISKREIEYVIAWDYPEGQEFKDYQEKHKLSDTEIACYFSFWKSLGKDWDMVRRQYPTTAEEALINISDLVFSGKRIDEMESMAARINDRWEYYKEPIVGHRYAIGADVGAGQGGDPSTASIFDLETNEEVACFEDSMTEPDMFAYQLAQAGKYYNTAYIACERNNVGVGVLAKLKEIYPYQQIHKEKSIGKRFDRASQRMGWFTTGATKPKMVADLKTAINQEEIVIWSPKTKEQLRGYTREEIIVNNRISVKYGDKNENGAHFDRVDALMIVWQVRADAMLNCFVLKKSNKMKDLIARRKNSA